MLFRSIAMERDRPFLTSLVLPARLCSVLVRWLCIFLRSHLCRSPFVVAAAAAAPAWSYLMRLGNHSRVPKLHRNSRTNALCTHRNAIFLSRPSLLFRFRPRLGPRTVCRLSWKKKRDNSQGLKREKKMKGRSSPDLLVVSNSAVLLIPSHTSCLFVGCSCSMR